MLFAGDDAVWDCWAAGAVEVGLLAGGDCASSGGAKHKVIVAITRLTMNVSFHSVDDVVGALKTELKKVDQ
jgi:hypothetical protein